MQCRFYQFLKKHWLVILVLLAIPIIFVLLLACLAFCDVIEIEDSDWISLAGAVLTYIGTTLVSAVAIYQSEKANQLSEQVYQLSERDYYPTFAIKEIAKIALCRCAYDEATHERILKDRVMFCNVDATPERCVGYQLCIKNFSNYPITAITCSTTYKVGRTRLPETLTENIETLIPPQKSHEFLLCNTPHFCYDGEWIIFNLTCKNIFDYSTQMELKIRNISAPNKTNSTVDAVEYKCRILK